MVMFCFVDFIRFVKQTYAIQQFTNKIVYKKLCNFE